MRAERSEHLLRKSYGEKTEGFASGAFGAFAEENRGEKTEGFASGAFGAFAEENRGEKNRRFCERSVRSIC